MRFRSQHTTALGTTFGVALVLGVVSAFTIPTAVPHRRSVIKEDTCSCLFSAPVDNNNDPPEAASSSTVEKQPVDIAMNNNTLKQPNGGEVDANADACADCFYLERMEYGIGSKPESAFILGKNNFIRQGSSIIKEAFAQIGITSKDYIPPSQMPPECLGLTLDSEAVKEAERVRERKMGGKVETNPASKLLYDVGCYALDELFDDRPIARFWFLETIARIPYFSYVCMLHLYESFGWWREPELRKVHNAQEYNELHHLLIMESLGGNLRWRDRFLGYHVAIGYYWAVNALFLFTPRAAYEFMELLEAHAVDTYSTFFKENKERLKTLPAPRVARSYYKGADLYMFDDFQVSKQPKSRRPPCDSLYDVFKNICQDEAEHVKTMSACKDYSKLGKIVVSPHLGFVDDESARVRDERRQAWLDWSEEVNRASTAEEDF